MLSQPDSRFVQRNRSLPGLRFLFDTRIIADYLKKNLPGLQIDEWKPGYVRYKPGTNCLVGYQAKYNGAESYLYATTYAPHCLKKFNREKAKLLTPQPCTGKRVLVDEFSSVLSIFPFDRKLHSLHQLANESERKRLFRELLPSLPTGAAITLKGLRYKPERRFVGKLLRAETDTPEGIVKFYRDCDYQGAKRAAETLNSKGVLTIPPLLTSSQANHALVFAWESGRPLEESLHERNFDVTTLRRVGKALREVHLQQTEGLKKLTPKMEAETLTNAASMLAITAPPLGSKAMGMAERLSHLLYKKRRVYSPVHGDFYGSQVLIGEREKVTILDFDRAVLGDPARDLGTFCAHVERDLINGCITYCKMVELKENLVDGYLEGEEVGDIKERIQLYTAVELFRLAQEPFRNRDINWTKTTGLLLTRAEMYLEEFLSCSHVSRKRLRVPIADPFQILKTGHINKLLEDALSPGIVEKGVKECMNSDLAEPVVQAIRVIRYKPLRRCLIEYDVEDEKSTVSKTVTLIGKIRCRGLDIRSYLVQHQLWNTNFGSQSSDRIFVPEPIGIVPDLNMLLYKRVEGVSSTALLAFDKGGIVGLNAARVAFKIHTSSVSPHRMHTVSDELKILQKKLPLVAKSSPDLTCRINRLLHITEELAGLAPKTVLKPIHRDFYSDQLLMDEESVYVVDFDLFCLGDPALDIGNFIGHIREQSLRTFGDPDAMSEAVRSIRDEYQRLSGDNIGKSIDIYTLLTLVRLIYISTLFPAREPFTMRLLVLCEEEIEAFVNGSRSKRSGEVK